MLGVCIIVAGIFIFIREVSGNDNEIVLYCLRIRLYGHIDHRYRQIILLSF